MVSIIEKREKIIGFDAERGEFNGLENSYRLYLIDKFPAVDVSLELRKMEAWLDANPKNRKSNYKRFITNWLTKAQDKAPRVEQRTNFKPLDDSRVEKICSICNQTFLISRQLLRTSRNWIVGMCPECYDDPANFASLEDYKAVLKEMKKIGAIPKP